jgi:predicted permease
MAARLRWLIHATGMRFLLRRKAAFAAATLTMALSVAANTAAFSVVKAFLISGLSVPDPDRLMLIANMRAMPGRGRVLFNDAYRNYELIRDTQRAFAAVATTFQATASWNDGAETHPVESARVTASFFPTMRVSPSVGRAFTREEEGPSPALVVVVSHEFWQSALSANSAALGQTLLLNGEPHRIIGIMPPGFSLPVQTDLWLPFDIPTSARTAITGARQLLTFGRIADGVTRERADADTRALTTRMLALSPENRDYDYELQSMREAVLAGAGATVLLVQVGASVLLLLAALNLASVLLAWGVERQTELAVRQALGAGSGTVRRLVMFQALTVVGISSMVGCALAYLVVAWLRQLELNPALGYFARKIAFDPLVLAFSIAVASVVGLIAASLPSWFANRTNLVTDLRAAGRSATLSRTAARCQSALVLVQTGTSVVVLAMAGLVALSFYNLSRVPLGFPSRDLIVARVFLQGAPYQQAPARARFADRLLANLAAEPSIAGAAFTSTLPVGDIVSGSRFYVPQPDGSVGAEPALFHIRRVSPRYLTTLGIPLLEGRQLEAHDDSASPRVAIVSRALAARYWPNESAVGKRILRAPGNNAPPEPYEVIGVVGDVKDAGSAAPVGEAVYVHWPQWSSVRMTLIVAARGRTESAVTALRRALRSTDPMLAATGVTTVPALVRQATALERLRSVLLVAFAATALMIAAIGCYGVMSQLVASRYREYAVRRALGATPRGLALSVVRRIATLAAPGAALGAVTAALFGGFLGRFVFGVDQRSAPMLAAVAALMLLMAILSTMAPALRAARVDPRISTAGE